MRHMRIKIEALVNFVGCVGGFSLNYSSDLVSVVDVKLIAHPFRLE